jgi:hypothetical protein
MESPSVSLTTLRNGPTLPTEVIEIALDLEARGLRLETDGPVLRVVGPVALLTAAERSGIRRYKPQFIALVDYCESGAATAPDRGVE